jgi:hypothetical protein
MCSRTLPSCSTCSPLHRILGLDTAICLDIAATFVRQVGVHPETGEPILANSGRFGPYLKHKTLTVTVPKGCGPLDVTLEQALAAVAAKETRMRARGRDPYEVRAMLLGGMAHWGACHALPLPVVDVEMWQLEWGLLFAGHCFCWAMHGKLCTAS